MSSIKAKQTMEVLILLFKRKKKGGTINVIKREERSQ